jgi:hypothetical protein
MLAHARLLGANAIIGMRYDATGLMAGLTELLCYGMVVVEREGDRPRARCARWARTGLCATRSIRDFGFHQQRQQGQ